MKNTLIVLLLATMPFVAVIAQENGDQNPDRWKKFIHVEAGLLYPEGTIKESVSIRQNISYYYVNQYSSGYVSSNTSGLVVGVRYGYFIPGIRSGISTGLRFNGFNTEISGYTSSISDFFFLRYSMEESDTKFARVKSLSESRYLLTVPLEVNFVPFIYKNASLFAKAGAEYSVVNFRSGAAIDFQDENMDIHEKAILGNISGAPNRQYATFYSSIGIKIGQQNGPNYLFEAFLPSFFLTKNNFSLIDVDYFAGFKLSIQFQVKNKN